MCHPLPLTGIDVQFEWDSTQAPSYVLNITPLFQPLVKQVLKWKP